MKEINDYLHLYLGCEVQTKGGPDGKHSRTGTFIGFADYHRMDCRLGLRGSPEGRCATFLLKPVLRPLSSMTKDEMIGLLQSTVPDDFEEKPTSDEYDLELFHDDYGNMVDGDCAVGADYSCRCYEGLIAIRKHGTIDLYDEEGNPERRINDARAFAYLLSKHFDLFGLIEDGLAIDRTTLK